MLYLGIIINTPSSAFLGSVRYTDSMGRAVGSLCLITFAFWLSGASADTNACVNEDPCTCKFNDGDVLSLRSLAKADSSAAFKVLNVQQSYDFFFNPCLTFTEGSCGGTDVAVCQDVIAQGQFGNYSCGTQSSAQFVHRDGDSSGLYLRYEDGDNGRKTYVKLTCNNASESTLSFVAENPLKVYNLELASPCACPGQADSCGKLPKVHCIKVSLKSSPKNMFLFLHN